MESTSDPAPDLAVDPAWGERPTWRSWGLPLVLLVLLLGVLATSVVLLVDRAQRGGDAVTAPPVPALIGDRGAPGDTPSAVAVNVARAVTRAYFTIDHRDVAGGVLRVRRVATAAFVRTYDDRLAGLRRRVERLGTDLSASLPTDGTATEYLSGSTARVLVSADVTTTSRGAEPRTVPVTARVSLERVGTRWLVSALDQVG